MLVHYPRYFFFKKKKDNTCKKTKRQAEARSREKRSDKRRKDKTTCGQSVSVFSSFPRTTQPPMHFCSLLRASGRPPPYRKKTCRAEVAGYIGAICSQQVLVVLSLALFYLFPNQREKVIIPIFNVALIFTNRHM